MIEIVLAGAPMGKERVRFVKATGRTFTPERTVNYESRLAYAAQQAMGDRPLFDGPLSVEVVAYMPVAESKPRKWKAAALAGEIRPTKKPDLDNLAKILDALNLVVWGDDAQIVEMHIAKHYSEAPRMEIRVRQINQPAGGIFE
jgi:Holliday junction resolvase RusA-like endonuclease